MGIFGWSLPPGVYHLPGEEDDRCWICERDPNLCVCPECDVCGCPGCFEHLPPERKAALEAAWADRYRREAEAEMRWFADEEQP
jgi:hypothetical protein